MDTAKSSDARDSDHKNRPAALVEISHQQQQQQKQLEFQGDLLGNDDGTLDSLELQHHTIADATTDTLQTRSRHTTYWTIVGQ
ncbi:hypothetical protein BASA60_005180 [Batrachochytrium salamandrivorans]|nr:hypothetical protein BASA60_005180 [Batrachochytrium salamandrivorans]